MNNLFVKVFQLFSAYTLFCMSLSRCQGIGLESVAEVVTTTVGDSAAIQSNLMLSSQKVEVCLYKDGGSGDYLKKWNKNSDSLLTYIICNVSEEDGGIYTFKVIFIQDTHPEKTAYSTVEFDREVKVRVDVDVRARIIGVSQSSVIVSVTDNVTCIAYGVPSPSVTWLTDANNTVSSDQSDGVYQIKNGTEATLFLADAQPSDAGKYKCKAKNNVGEDDTFAEDFRVIKVEVYGSPIILRIFAFSCRTTIEVFWQPGLGSRKINHKITATSNSTLSPDSKSQTINPNETKTINTTFEDLQPMTLYYIEISVCPDICIANLSESDTGTTGVGKPDIVTDATVEQIENGGKCNLTWSPPLSPSQDKVTKYMVEIKATSFDASQNDIIVENEMSNLTFSIQPISGYNYSFMITAVSCAGNGKETVARGTCIKYENKDTSIAVGLIVGCSLIATVLIAIAVVALIWICRDQCCYCCSPVGNETTRRSKTFNHISTNCGSNNDSNPEPKRCEESTVSALPALKNSERNNSGNEYGEQTFTRYDSVLEEGEIYEIPNNPTPHYENMIF